MANVEFLMIVCYIIAEAMFVMAVCMMGVENILNLETQIYFGHHLFKIIFQIMHGLLTLHMLLSLNIVMLKTLTMSAVLDHEFYFLS